jgi:hypothetical protein
MANPLRYIVILFVRPFARFYLLISDIRMNGTDLSLLVFMKRSNNDYG